MAMLMQFGIEMALAYPLTNSPFLSAQSGLHRSLRNWVAYRCRIEGSSTYSDTRKNHEG